MATVRMFEQQDGSYEVHHRQQVHRWPKKDRAMAQVKNIFSEADQAGQIYHTDRDGLESNITKVIERMLTRNRSRQVRRRYRAGAA